LPVWAIAIVAWGAFVAILVSTRRYFDWEGPRTRSSDVMADAA
jgi:hypothetical protein